MGSVLFLNTVGALLLWSVQSNFAATVTRSTLVGEIEGFTNHVVVNGETKDITRFLGIPYAEPPTGPNRFAKPVPKSRFNNVFRANDGSVACVQTSKEGTAWYSEYVSNFTEDCLTLNIYVPSNFSDDSSTLSLPTMVWIYGGSFTSGTTAAYDPVVLSVTTNTIVVTVNYRVGMFGFLQSKDGRFKGNQGLWDQHLAIKWVNGNIGSFYGSPSIVTIFGESAGGASVLYQAIYPGNKGLFQRAIAESGSLLADWALTKAPNAEEYFKTVGCMTSDPMACLSSKSYEEIQTSQEIIFAPVVDGDFLTESPEHILFGKNTASQAAREFYYSLDILSGVNQFDGALFALYWSNFLKGLDFNNPNVTRDELKNVLFLSQIKSLSDLDMDTTRLILDLLEFEYINWSDPDSYNTTRLAGVTFGNDMFFFYPGIRAAQSHLAQNSNSRTYFYEFCPRPTNTMTETPAWLPGANHADEIQSVLGYPLNANASMSYTPDEEQLAWTMMTTWSNFAKTGDPNKPLDVTKYINTTWPEYDMTSQKYLKISNEMSADSVTSHFYPRRMHLWSDLLPSIIESQRYESTTTTTTPKPLKIDFSGIIGK